MTKRRVSLYGTRTGSTIIDDEATKGATLGVNLYDKDGNLVSLDELKKAVQKDLDQYSQIINDSFDYATAINENVQDGFNAIDATMADINSRVATLNAQIGDIMDADTWDAGETYPLGDLVKLNGNLYRSLIDNNIGNNPSTDDGTHWKKMGQYSSLGEAVAANVHNISVNDQRITTNGNKIVVQGQTIDTIQARMPAGNGDVASAAALTSTQSQVSTNSGNISSLSQTVSQHTSQIASKASASALSATQTQVNQIDGQVTSQASQISSLSSKANGNTASIISLQQVVTGSGGLTSQYVLRLDANKRVVGWRFMNNGSTGRFDVRTDYFSLVTPSGNAFMQWSSSGLTIGDAGGANIKLYSNGTARFNGTVYAANLSGGLQSRYSSNVLSGGSDTNGDVYSSSLTVPGNANGPLIPIIVIKAQWKQGWNGYAMVRGWITVQRKVGGGGWSTIRKDDVYGIGNDNNQTGPYGLGQYGSMTYYGTLTASPTTGTQYFRVRVEGAPAISHLNVEIDVVGIR